MCEKKVNGKCEILHYVYWHTIGKDDSKGLLSVTYIYLVYIAAVDDILGSTYIFNPLPRCTCSSTVDSLSHSTSLLLVWREGGQSAH